MYSADTYTGYIHTEMTLSTYYNYGVMMDGGMNDDENECICILIFNFYWFINDYGTGQWAKLQHIGHK